jgi:hypothetical protein
MLKKRYVKSRQVCKVTFEIPKADLPKGVRVESVCLVGEFNDWNMADTPMTRNRRGNFRIMVELAPGRAYEFRYLINGKHWYNDWQADAYVPGAFGADNSVVLTLTGDET